ncbi:hypothetical protein NEISICOT_02918 [Neisseria sicca ATCC 29256]|uniref:Uncharacterized protein n=1 Tax=Neisseria sicca ATCC 29256 TaxID=547045 RepID=C6M8P5_NEISI|nr:hypothetical protein NEISICOT_02918 [Neisseria sicca ATCC 29256]
MHLSLVLAALVRYSAFQTTLSGRFSLFFPLSYYVINQKSLLEDFL